MICPSKVRSLPGVMTDKPVTVSADVAVKKASLNDNRPETVIPGKDKSIEPRMIIMPSPAASRRGVGTRFVKRDISVLLTDIDQVKFSSFVI